MTKRVWAELTREQLIEESAKWGALLREVNRDLRGAKRRAYVEKIYLTDDQLNNMETRRETLASAVRGIQAELTKKKLKRTFAEYFYDAADDILEDGRFNLIYDRAEALMEADNAKPV